MGDGLRGEPGKLAHASISTTRVDLDGSVEGQGGHADGGAGMLAGLAEDLGDQVRGAVDDEVLFGEIRGRGHEARSA